MTEFKIINPYLIETLHTQAFDTKNTCEDKLIKLNHSFQQWKEQPMHDRQRWLIQLASNITKKKSKIATLISTDMGKPVTEALKEVDKCIQCCQFYAQKIDSITEKLNEENGQRLPVGVILGIMPWNFPIWQLIRFIVPAIIVGNTCAIKPAHNTFRVAASLLECSPKTNPIIDCIIPSDHDASKLIGHPLVAGVSFTGSVNVGRKIGQLAAEHFKPCVLELGGSDPYIIFENADLEPAISTAVNARFSNSGQTCISAKRFLFEATIFEKAMTLFQEKTSRHLHYNNPVDPTTTLGPMARENLQQQVLDQLKRGELDSQQIRFKYIPKTPPQGYFIAPHIIDARTLHQNNPLLIEEVFGPIAICDSFESTDDAIEKANRTTFGLAASIWSNDPATVNACIKHIECGTVAINKAVHSAFDTPFGGWKQSGIGLELGISGAISFTRFKAIQ